jgi:hypothetical protein
MSAERIKAWQCIGCGRIEGHQPCIGICEDRPQHFVYADDYDRLESLVRQLATVTPRDGDWERTYRALQQRARELLNYPEVRKLVSAV